jgi:transcription termination factor Rho
MTAITAETTEEQLRVSAETHPVAGIVDISDGRGYLRTGGYRRSPGDIQLTTSQVRQYGLRKGDEIEGTVPAASTGTDNGNGTRNSSRNGKAGENGSGSRNRQQNGASLASVTAINGLPPDVANQRPHFDDLTPVYPNQRFRLEDGDPSPAARIIDLVSPIGKGQRGLIVAPPKAGKTTVLKTIAHAIAAAYPEVHLMLVLVGERPEEVTDLRRSVRGQVIASTFDQSPDDHVRAAPTTWPRPPAAAPSAAASRRRHCSRPASSSARRAAWKRAARSPSCPPP